MRPIRIARLMTGILLTAGALLVLATPAFAHDQPAGAEWLMADWMLFSFMVFGGAGLAVFLVALKRGHFHNMEGAKYQILSIEEPDYYTPDWAREEAQEDPDADRR
jgi:Cytochrome oxidase maturation protein cbb3-type